MHTFKTRSTSEKSVRTIIYTCIPMLALAFLGLKISIIAWLFFEGILLFTFAFCLLLSTTTHWEIEFRNNCVHLYNTGNRKSFVLDQLTQSDFIIKQNEKQKTKNTCDMRIADTPFVLSDVQSYQQMQSYIQENFPN